MFVGEYNRSVDGAGRLALPADCRHDLGEHCFITEEPIGCLSLRSAETFAAVREDMTRKRQLGEITEAEQRAFGARTVRAKVDGHGRITLDAERRAHGGIGKEVTLIGVLDHLEIWRPSRYDVIEGELDQATLKRDWGDEDDA